MFERDLLKGGRLVLDHRDAVWLPTPSSRSLNGADAGGVQPQPKHEFHGWTPVVFRIANLMPISADLIGMNARWCWTCRWLPVSLRSAWLTAVLAGRAGNRPFSPSGSRPGVHAATRVYPHNVRLRRNAPGCR